VTVTARFRKGLAVTHGTPQRGGDSGAGDGMAFVLTLTVQTAVADLRVQQVRIREATAWLEAT
jgi:hypothetical protein